MKQFLFYVVLIIYLIVRARASARKRRRAAERMASAGSAQRGVGGLTRDSELRLRAEALQRERDARMQAISRATERSAIVEQNSMRDTLMDPSVNDIADERPIDAELADASERDVSNFQLNTGFSRAERRSSDAAYVAEQEAELRSIRKIDLKFAFSRSDMQRYVILKELLDAPRGLQPHLARRSYYDPADRSRA